MRLKPKVIILEPDFRRFKIPEGFVLLQDTREQRPLFDSTIQIDGLEVITDTVPCGDYTVKGFEDRFAIERKQISDFYSYIGKERDRTTRKMQEFREISQKGGFCGLVIEATESDLLSGYVMSRVSPETARMALVSFEIRSGVHVYYSRSRDDCRRWILDRAIKFYMVQREVKP